MTKHKAVGGLISILGLVAVFTIISVAFLNLSSAQLDFANTTIILNEKISEKNSEHLNFDTMSFVPVSNSYEIIVNNQWSERTTFVSFAVLDASNLITAWGERAKVVITGGGGSDAKATANVANGVITSIDVISGGSEYSTNPIITITHSIGAGTEATATANVANGVITSIDVGIGGTGYGAITLAGKSGTITLQDSSINKDNDKNIILITDTGKKCMFPKTDDGITIPGGLC